MRKAFGAFALAIAVAGLAHAQPAATVTEKWDNGESFEGPAYDGNRWHSAYGTWRLANGDHIVVDGRVSRYFHNGAEITGAIEFKFPRRLEKGAPMPDVRSTDERRLTVFAAFVVGTDGRARNVRLVRSSGIAEFDQWAVTGIRNSVYDTMELDGKAYDHVKWVQITGPCAQKLCGDIPDTPEKIDWPSGETTPAPGRIAVTWKNGDRFEGPAFDGNPDHAGYGIWTAANGFKIVVDGRTPELFAADGAEITSRITLPASLTAGDIEMDDETLAALNQRPSGAAVGILAMIVAADGNITGARVAVSTGSPAIDETMKKMLARRHYWPAMAGGRYVPYPRVAEICVSTPKAKVANPCKSAREAAGWR